MPENGAARLDRIEGIIEALATRQADIEDEFRRLLTAQVLLTDAQRKTEEKVQALADAQREFVAAQRHTEQRLNALIAVVDDPVRRRPPPQQ
jgi:hypothetical protein